MSSVLSRLSRSQPGARRRVRGAGRWVYAGVWLLLAATPLIGPSAVAPSVKVWVAVDLTRPVAVRSANSYGTSITGYGHGSYLTNSRAHRDAISRLGLGVMRIELRYAHPGDPASPLTCGGVGCAQEVPGEDWISAIRQAGAEPMVILPLDGRHAAEIDEADAVNIYRQLAATGRPVRRYVVGNEPDNARNPKHMDVGEYSRRFKMIAQTLHRLDPEVRIGGPATTYYNTAYLDAFLHQGGRDIDIVDFHKYGQGGTDNLVDSALLGERVRSYTSQLANLRRRIDAAQPERSGQIEMQIGEYNLDWDGDVRITTNFNAVWSAATLGSILETGAVAVQYGDKNGGLGLTGEPPTSGIPVDQPLPIYHGIGMFTGEGLFRPFGDTVVRTRVTSPLIDAFASNHATNVVLVNLAQRPSSVTIRFTGLDSGVAERWQLDADSPTPGRVDAVPVAHGGASLTLPARSVTTLVVDPDPAY